MRISISLESPCKELSFVNCSSALWREGERKGKASVGKRGGAKALNKGFGSRGRESNKKGQREIEREGGTLHLGQRGAAKALNKGFGSRGSEREKNKRKERDRERGRERERERAIWLKLPLLPFGGHSLGRPPPWVEFSLPGGWTCLCEGGLRPIVVAVFQPREGPPRRREFLFLQGGPSSGVCSVQWGSVYFLTGLGAVSFTWDLLCKKKQRRGKAAMDARPQIVRMKLAERRSAPRRRQN